MSTKYIVWIRASHDDAGLPIEKPTWEPNGDGPMGLKTAERVAREVREDFRIPTRVFQDGYQPKL